MVTAQFRCRLAIGIARLTKESGTGERRNFWPASVIYQSSPVRKTGERRARPRYRGIGLSQDVNCLAIARETSGTSSLRIPDAFLEPHRVPNALIREHKGH